MPLPLNKGNKGSLKFWISRPDYKFYLHQMHLQCLCCDWEDGVFLGSMHGSLVGNTNLTALQFIRAYKRLLFDMKGDINADKFN